MRVLVDTCVWSEILRRKTPDPARAKTLTKLIQEGRVVLIGPIRQELLSGLSDSTQFTRLKETLAAFDDIPLESDHFVTAAEFSNTCRKKGVQGSTIDFLICAVACQEELLIFTTDKDFHRYKKHLPIELL
jgi:predicted nucleic acid-binding protein